MEQLMDKVHTEDPLSTLKKSRIPTIELRYKHKAGHLDQPKLTTAEATYHYLLKTWDPNKIQLCEQFKVLLLDNSCRPLGVTLLSQGSGTGTVVSTTFIFALAILANASSLIVAHNHPSGNLTPSRADEILTERIKEIGSLHEIKLLDHLIVTPESFYSFANEGRL